MEKVYLFKYAKFKIIKILKDIPGQGEEDLNSKQGLSLRPCFPYFASFLYFHKSETFSTQYLTSVSLFGYDIITNLPSEYFCNPLLQYDRHSEWHSQQGACSATDAKVWSSGKLSEIRWRKKSYWFLILLF